MDPHVDYGPLPWKLYIFFIVFNLGMPWFFLSLRLLYVLRVRFVTGIVHQEMQSGAGSDGHGGAAEWWNILISKTSRVGIMAVCPIAIPIPADLDNETKDKVECMKSEKRCTILSSSQLEKLCPLVMMPSKSGDMCGRYGGMGGSISGAAPTAAYYNNGEDQLQYLYFTGHENDDSWQLDRVALLKLGLAPPYDQLRYLRSRSRFQAVITVLQTLGFVVGVAERISEQGLGVSPAEVIVCFFAVISTVQVGLDLYSCSSFHTPLLLSLSPSQFRAFIHDDRSRCGNLSDYKNPRFSHITKIVGLLLLTVAAGPSIYYTYHYWDKASMVTRAVFLVFLLSYLCRPIVVALIDLGSLDSQVYFALASMLVTVVVAILAIAATVVEWEELFQAAARDTFAWVFPHVYAN